MPVSFVRTTFRASFSLFRCDRTTSARTLKIGSTAPAMITPLTTAVHSHLANASGPCSCVCVSLFSCELRKGIQRHLLKQTRWKCAHVKV